MKERALDEAQVIAQVRGGTTEAFGEIVEYYQAPVIRYLFRMTGDQDLAEDLAQDTFIQAYKSILKTTSELSLKAWLYKIATNNARQFHRRPRLLSFIPLTGWEKLEAPSTESPQDAVGERTAIEDALVKVSHEQRVCMVLHFVEGLKYREIADIVGVSEEAVRKRVARGSKEFRSVYRAASGEKE